MDAQKEKLKREQITCIFMNQKENAASWPLRDHPHPSA